MMTSLLKLAADAQLLTDRRCVMKLLIDHQRR